MCHVCLPRRRFLAGAAATALLPACDGPPELVSDEQVRAMGVETWERIRAEIPASRDNAYQQTLADVARRLLEADGKSPAEWDVMVFADPQINAFALPGNKIGIYEGMFQVFQNEDQLAAVVGHEIGHLDAEHAQKRISAQVAKEAGVQIVNLVLNMGDIQFANEIAAALGLGMEVGLLLPYSRDHELEADRLGLQKMDAAGFAPAEAITLWERMAEASGGRGPEFLATHPTPASRIREIEEILQTL